ncbi:MAG: hypothetical protein WCW56_00675 [Candidatus Paceibacterota bacterium]|jgi:hypothetical protein
MKNGNIVRLFDRVTSPEDVAPFESRCCLLLAVILAAHDHRTFRPDFALGVPGDTNITQRHLDWLVEQGYIQPIMEGRMFRVTDEGCAWVFKDNPSE